MTERELSDHCRDLVESLGTREASQTFITERNIKRDEFRQSDNKRKFAVKDRRSEEKRLANAGFSGKRLSIGTEKMNSPVHIELIKRSFENKHTSFQANHD